MKSATVTIPIAMNLTLAEEVILLSLDDRTGHTVCAHTGYAVSAAILAELAVLGRVTIDGDAVRLVDQSAVDHSVLNEAVGMIGNFEGKLSWLIRAPLAENQRERVIERLVTLGILERVEKKALGLFRYRRYPEHDGSVEAGIRSRLRAAALGTGEADSRTCALLSIAHAAGLLDTFLSKEEKRNSEDRVKALTESDPVGEALFLAIRDDDGAAATAAITVAIT